ncbi:MAG TPA: bacteriohopanetetrol glucosamine biosynthesis glycosyltransferase HpnI [Terriglobales bacterium]|jgi:ceramide glucosyltransferase|nr:bacteriohopanetetrol glucosamine biosynthesis glycosyltransferase HpnI [Terriglobales bacterium]
MLHLAIEAVLALLTLCGIAFYLIALWSARDFRRESSPPLASKFLPAVSILKPLKGADSQTYAALRSHCEQQYATYEILFGVNDSNDEAVPLVRKLIAEFPNREISLIVCGEVFGSNRKVSNLIHLLHQAKYQYVVVNDGDIKVSPGYLQAVMSDFHDPQVGMVTCLYKGNPAKTLGSRLETLGIATDFAPGVLTARLLDRGLTFGLGSTLAMSRTALEKIGGFHAVVDCLADDYELGKRIADGGFKVALSHEIVETSVPAYSFQQFWEHQLRWARTMRVSRSSGYRGLALTYGLPWAILLAVVAPGSWWAWTLLATALLTRCAVALSVGVRTLRDQHVLPNLWLLPLRDLLALAIWFASYAGNTVVWRGEKFRLERGRMYPISHAPESGIAKSEQHVDTQTQR